jgi:hypothetical protein
MGAAKQLMIEQMEAAAELCEQCEKNPKTVPCERCDEPCLCRDCAADESFVLCGYCDHMCHKDD